MSEQLKNKILNMEVAPPPAAWDFIAAELDKNTVSGEAAIQYKMNQMEANPPSFIWTAIEKELDKNEPGKQEYLEAVLNQYIIG